MLPVMKVMGLKDVSLLSKKMSKFFFVISKKYTKAIQTKTLQNC